MSKLTKKELKLQQQVNAILAQDILSRQDKLFVLEHFNEAALVEVASCAAFFTPIKLAWDVALEAADDYARPQRILDLCSGIGILAFACLSKNSAAEIVCVEQNPEFVNLARSKMGLLRS